MNFRDIKENFPIFILDKNNVELIKGKVTAVSFPHADNGNNSQDPFAYPNYNSGQNGQQRMVVDLTIEAGGRSATYVVSENASVNYHGSLIIATEQHLLASEVEAIKNAADQALSKERLEQLKNQQEKSTALLAQINPTFKQQQDNEARFDKIEATVNSMKEMMQNFIKEFKS